MYIYTDNNFLKQGMKALLGRRFVSDNGLIALDISYNQFAILKRSNLSQEFHNSLHSYTTLCAGVISEKLLYNYFTSYSDLHLLCYPPRRLTQRELNVADYLLSGHTPYQAAKFFQMNVKTVYALKSHVQNKIEVSSWAQLAIRLHAWEKNMCLLRGWEYPTHQSKRQGVDIWC